MKSKRKEKKFLKLKKEALKWLGKVRNCFDQLNNTRN